jgi:hypothetical protein
MPAVSASAGLTGSIASPRMNWLSNSVSKPLELVLTWPALTFQPNGSGPGAMLALAPARCTVELNRAALEPVAGEAVVVDADIAEAVESVDRDGPACVVKVGPA